MNTLAIRKPAVAGRFYPADAAELNKSIAALTDKKPRNRAVTGCILPHAGYIYSGRVAAETLLEIQPRKNIILLGPNHTGYGSPLSIMSNGLWETPIGKVKINNSLAADLLNEIPELKDDSSAHTYEHSLEVELPLLLRYFGNDFSIAPITIADDNINTLRKLGKGLANVINTSGLKESTLIIASSDMTHYESKASAEKKDAAAIKAILSLDETLLMGKIEELGITMCGYMPAIALMVASKALGAVNAELVMYQTSAEATKDNSSVVGYAGIIIY